MVDFWPNVVSKGTIVGLLRSADLSFRACGEWRPLVGSDHCEQLAVDRDDYDPWWLYAICLEGKIKWHDVNCRQRFH